MSVSIQPQDVADMVTTTLKNLGKGRVRVLGNKFRACIVVKHWFNKKVLQQSGTGWQKQVITKFSNQAVHQSPMSTDTVAVPTIMGQISGTWAHVQSSYAMAYQELLMNRGKEQLFDLVTARRIDAVGSLTEELERKAWQLPAATDTTSPKGVPYWITYNATTGFNGGSPSGYSNVGNLDPNSVPNSRWKNYTANYTNVTTADLYDKWKLGHRKCQWISPVKAPEYSQGNPNAMIYYTSDEIAEQLITFAETRNENLGFNLAGSAVDKALYASDLKYADSELMFRRHPIVSVPIFSDSSEYSAQTDPIYGINHETFGVVALSGDVFREGDANQVSMQHNVFQSFIDLTYNYWCDDRSRNMLIAKG
jgi:hypothetical protein